MTTKCGTHQTSLFYKQLPTGKKTCRRLPTANKKRTKTGHQPGERPVSNSLSRVEEDRLGIEMSGEGVSKAIKAVHLWSVSEELAHPHQWPQHRYHCPKTQCTQSFSLLHISIPDSEEEAEEPHLKKTCASSSSQNSQVVVRWDGSPESITSQ